jgi:hypothetical protein
VVNRKHGDDNCYQSPLVERRIWHWKALQGTLGNLSNKPIQHSGVIETDF